MNYLPKKDSKAMLRLHDPCVLCGVDFRTVPMVPPPNEAAHGYMVTKDVWEREANMHFHAGQAHLRCLEARIGRTLEPKDFTAAPLNFWNWRTPMAPEPQQAPVRSSHRRQHSRKLSVVLLGLFLVGCAEHEQAGVRQLEGNRIPSYGCYEFVWNTRKANVAIRCQMLWCGSGIRGGPTTLWCEPK